MHLPSLASTVEAVRCKATTTKGKRCKNSAGPSGYCYAHPPEDRPIYDDGLNERRRRFVEFYLGEAAGNGTRAYQMAYGEGLDDSTASSNAHRLLRNADVQAAIDARVEQDPGIATRQELQRFWTGMMYGEDGDVVFDLRGQPVGTTSKARDRLKASELLAKTHGAFIDRIEHSGPGGGPIPTTMDLSKLDDEDLLEMRRILQKAHSGDGE